MLNHALETLTTTLATELQALKVNVVKHQGRFSVEDLKTYSLKPRTLIVCITRVGDIEIVGIAKATLKIDCFVVVGQGAGDRDVTAMNIVNQLLLTVPFNRFGSNQLLPTKAAQLEARNLFTGNVGRQGVALWAVTWKQPIKYPR